MVVGATSQEQSWACSGRDTCSGLPCARGCAGLGAGLLWPHCHVTKTLCGFKGFAQKLSVPFFVFLKKSFFISELMREVLKNILRLKTHFLPILKFWGKQYLCHFSWAAPPKYLSWFRKQWNLGNFSDAGKSVSFVPCAGEVSNVALESKVVVFRKKKTSRFYLFYWRLKWILMYIL